LSIFIRHEGSKHPKEQTQANKLKKKKKLEQVEIANALQLEGHTASCQ